MKQLLTGKCQEDFEKWYLEDYLNTVHNHRQVIKYITGSFGFYWQPLSEKWGVIQDFADSKGFKMNIDNTNHQNWFFFHLKTPHIHESIKQTELQRTRPEARKEAIKALVTKYNQDEMSKM